MTNIRTAASSALAAGCAALAAFLAPAALSAQDPLAHYADAFEPQFDAGQPAIRYTVRVDTTNTRQYTVAMHLEQADDTVRLRLPEWAPGAYRTVHFAQYVHDLSAVGPNDDQRLAVRAIPDSSLWIVPTANGTADVRYTVRFPSATAASTPNNRSFLTAQGGLFDGPLTYLYIEGQKLVPAHVTFELPASWRIATGLVPTADAHTFFAPSYDVLIDSPVLAGPPSRLPVWHFDVAGVPHRVAYWTQPGAPAFDSAAFVRTARTAVQTARGIMGRLPYREYTFLFVDGGGGGLEHLNSTTIGAPGTTLARDATARAGTTAHEFFHLWNVKRIRPAVLGPFDYQHQVRTTDLWWSEGVTDFFAEEIARRAGWYDEAAARAALAGSIESYLGNPAHDRISPERSSWTAWDPPSANDGYAISYYLQGGLLGELLELQLRAATDGARGMDDVIRLLFDRYAGAQGFRGEDLVHSVNDVCGCDLQPFFDAHVSSARPIDVDRALALMGLRTVVTRGPMRDANGAPAPDLRIGVSSFGGIGSAGGAAGARPRLSLNDPTSAWVRGGLRGGEPVVSVNGRAVSDPQSFRAAIGTPKIGDVVRVTVERRRTRRDGAGHRHRLRRGGRPAGGAGVGDTGHAADAPDLDVGPALAVTGGEPAFAPACSPLVASSAAPRRAHGGEKRRARERLFQEGFVRAVG